uniref:Ig-like domain-containing protein n=1 Tax=Gadus morhua TaxID=8049 RepID=A0A8C5CVF7_GADMO
MTRGLSPRLWSNSLCQHQLSWETLWLSTILGEDVTLHCGVRKERFIHWYKLSIGYVPQKVATRMANFRVIPPFDSRFTAAEPDMDLNIRSVTKEDEANYFCQEYDSENWKSGFFLSVKGKISSSTCFLYYHLKVPASASAQLGDPVALQCSITSQRTDHSNQCQEEPSVYWFRSGPSHPAAIYMNGNRSGECQDSSGPPSAPQSWVYTLPKNKVDSSDAGTYYCALAACGEVVFGSGTKLDVLQNGTNKTAIVVLGILLACCLVVIIILLLTRNRKQVCEHCKEDRNYKGATNIFYLLITQEG